MSHRGKRNSNGNAESVHSTASKTSGSIKDSSKNVPPRRFSASLKHFITAGALAIGLFVLKNFSGKNGPLPHGAYALCTPNGQNIYTVDSLNSKVQCMVVENSRIIDLGPLRQLFQMSIDLLLMVFFVKKATCRLGGRRGIALPQELVLLWHIFQFASFRQEQLWYRD